MVEAEEKGERGEGWVGSGGLGWVGLGWVGLGWVGLGGLGWVRVGGWVGHIPVADPHRADSTDTSAVLQPLCFG